MRKVIMFILYPIEEYLLRNLRYLRAMDYDDPPIFIIGPPRSGTTLLYSALVSRFRFAYISNFAHRLYMTPVTATLVGKFWITAWRGSFKNSYGHINGFWSPNEGGWIWNRWFPEPCYLDENAMDKLPVKIIRETINSISIVLKAPFINKNVMHSVHIRLLNKLFPNCLFIETERNILDNVRSIVRIYQNRTANSDWISVKPNKWENFKNKNTIYKALAQVIYTKIDIENDIKKIGNERRLKIEYSKLCSDPELTMIIIKEFLLNHGMKIKDNKLLPPKFYESKNRYLSAFQEAYLNELIKEIYSDTFLERSMLEKLSLRF